MSVDVNSYFRGLRSFLNTKTYEVLKRDGGRIVLEEKIFLAGGAERKEKVRLGYNGEVIVIRLDQKQPQQPLFHFLEDDSKPWAKRCDFVIFHLSDKKVNVYCIEFKSASIPDGVVEQLTVSEAWCKSLHEIINLYTGKKKRMHLRKYVFTCMDTPDRYLDANGYLKRDHSIRHYHYDSLKSFTLEMLNNDCPVIIG